VKTIAVLVLGHLAFLGQNGCHNIIWRDLPQGGVKIGLVYLVDINKVDRISPLIGDEGFVKYSESDRYCRFLGKPRIGNFCASFFRFSIGLSIIRNSPYPGLFPTHQNHTPNHRMGDSRQLFLNKIINRASGGNYAVGHEWCCCDVNIDCGWLTDILTFETNPNADFILRKPNWADTADLHFHPRPMFGDIGFSGEVNSVNGGIRRFASKIDRQRQSNESYKPNSYLYVVERDGLLRSFRHAPLLAQIGFVVITGFLAIWFCPIGFDRLFPLKAERANHGFRKRLVGFWLSLIGWGSCGLLLLIVFLSIQS